MTDDVTDDVIELAQWLWDNQQNRVHPAWDQLVPRGATQSVWIESAQAQLYGELA